MKEGENVGNDIQFGLYRKVRTIAPMFLWVFGAAGILAVLMDADHLVPAIARQTHPIVVLVLGIVCVGYTAYVAGFNDRHMLRIIERKEKVKECVKIEID